MEFTAQEVEILREGTIRITPDGKLIVEDFKIKGTLKDLYQIALARLRLCVSNCEMYWPDGSGVKQ